MIRPLRTDADLDAALLRTQELWGAPPGTPEADELDVLLVLVEAYEKKYELPPGDPVVVVRHKLDELRWSQNRLAKELGWTSGRVSEVLTGKRELTVAMIRRLAEVLSIPAGVLLGDVRGASGRIEVRDAALAELVGEHARAVGASFDEALGDLVRLGLAVASQNTSTQTAGSSVAAACGFANQDAYPQTSGSGALGMPSSWTHGIAA